MASNSRPSSSICSFVRWASGLSTSSEMSRSCLLSTAVGGFIGALLLVVFSKLDLDVALGGVHAGADHLARLPGDFPGAQVPNLARAQLPDAGVADADPAPEGGRRSGILAGDQDRGAPVGVRLDVALQELDRTALAVTGVAADDGLEALEPEAIAVALLLPVLDQCVQQLCGSADEGIALTPVRAELFEVLGLESAHLPGHLPVNVEAIVSLLDLAELLAEDDVVLVARRMDEDDVVDRVTAVEVAQHAHDRRDARPRADEEGLLGRLVRKDERALHGAEADDLARFCPLDEIRRDLALVHELGSDRDAAVGPSRVGRQRVGTPVVDAVDHDTDPQVLARLVALPFEAGLDEDRRCVLGFLLDAHDPTAQLAGGPQRVDQLQVVVGQQRREQRAHRAQRACLQRMDLWGGAAFSHREGRVVSE